MPWRRPSPRDTPVCASPGSRARPARSPWPSSCRRPRARRPCSSPGGRARTAAGARPGRGARLDRELLLEALARAGYERVDTVVEVGQWSLRGGIVDVFAPTHAGPARLRVLGADAE